MSALFFLLSIAAIFTYCTGMTDTHILPKWLCTLGMVAVVGMIEGLFILSGKQRRMKGLSSFTAVAFLCLCQAVYAIVQAIGLCPSHFSYRVVGSFDNPAGLAACLSVGIPCCIYLFRTWERKILKGASVLMALFIATALLLSESRTGILAGILLPAAWWMFTFIKKRWVKLAVLGIGVVLMSIMYMAKKDSADGRLLMLRCGWEMVKDKPLFGHGMGGVQAQYMDYQAEWLAVHPESDFSMLADNVKSVFNEYLTIGICFGMVGWLFLGLYVWLMIHSYRKAPSEEGRFALMSLAIIGVLGCFSYPFSYPFTWVVLVWGSYILLHGAYPITLPTHKAVRYTMGIVLFGVSSLLLYGVAKRTRAELEWGKVSRLALTGRSEEAFPRYKALMPVLGNEPYFLYNYAAELYMADRHEEALYFARRCRTHWADYDLELLQGELLNELNRYDEAEHHFQLAANMCPVRFVPLHSLLKLYQQAGDTVRADSMAQEIIDKPVKIPSENINRIKTEARKWQKRTLPLPPFKRGE
ncbi:MAG: O-antigen ligase family protein [Bacteroidaceae bacterium]|nr:O-antigen ligase family protein [Bacteroidaceae bacterium]